VLKAKRTERGSTVAIMAASMVFMIAMAAIGIDVVVLYVVRSEAQRAADAAALAGAHEFVITGLTSSNLSQGQLCNGSGSGSAQEAAIKTAAQNNVAGQPGVVLSGDVTCDFSQPTDPRITVKVTRQNLPTFFSRIWGNSVVGTVSASATAEAYNESGFAKPAVSSCLKPFLVYNWDPWFNQQYVDVTNNGQITRPQNYPAGFVGETITLQPGDPTLPPMKGMFYQLQFTSTPTLCPSGCLGTNDSYQQNIQCCNSQALQCGVSTYSVYGATPDTTDTSNGTQCLIHAQAGADTINLNTSPFQFLAGAGNPAHVGQGSSMTTSDSLVTLPLFTTSLPTVPAAVQPIGFLQVFVQSVDTTSGKIQGVIVNVVGCGTNGPTGNAFISGGGVSPIPVRLVQPGGGGN